MYSFLSPHGAKPVSMLASSLKLGCDASLFLLEAFSKIEEPLSSIALIHHSQVVDSKDALEPFQW